MSKAAPPTEFQSSGSTKVTGTGEIFIDLIPSMISLLSAGDEFIANQLSSSPEEGNYEPVFFQLPYIQSIINNVNKKNYTSSSSTSGDLVTSIYKIPYEGLVGKSTATFIVFDDIKKQVMTYEIPRELSYNSVDQASVYVTSNNNSVLNNLVIPQSFYLSGSNLGKDIMSFTLTNNKINNKFGESSAVLCTFGEKECTAAFQATANGGNGGAGGFVIQLK